jgi:streptogramin lyase
MLRPGFTTVLAALVVTSFSACGGSNLPGRDVPVAAARQSADVQVGGAGPITSDASAAGTADFSIIVPVARPAKVAPKYISSGTKSIRFALVVANGKRIKKPIASIVELTAANTKDCATTEAATLSCRFEASVPAGAAVFAVSLFASSDASGKALASGDDAVSIKGGKSSRVRLALDGIPAAIMLSSSHMSALPNGTLQKASFKVWAEDASGGTIIGPARYSKPIYLQVARDPYGALSLSTDMIFLPANPVSGQTTIEITYNSAQPLSAGIIQARARGTKVARIVFAPLNVVPNALLGFFVGAFAPQPQTISVSEAAYSGAFSVAGATNLVSALCVPSNCTPTQSGVGVPITFTPLAPGSGAYSVGDEFNTTMMLPYRVSTWANFSTIAVPGRVNNIVSGPDHNLWAIVQAGANGQFSQMTTNGAVTTYALPSPFNPANSPDAVAGTDAAIWFTDGSTPYIYRLSTAAGSIGSVTKFATADGANPVNIVRGFDGETFWFTDSLGNIGNINESRPTATYVINPYAKGHPGPSSSLAYDPYNNHIYFIQGQAIFMLSPSGIVAPLPPAKQLNNGYSPNLIAIGPDRNLWLAASNGAVCSDGTTQSCFSTALTGSISDFATGLDGALWATGIDGNDRSTIVRIETSGQQTTYRALDCCPVQNNIAIGPDGALWFASTTGFDRVVP